MKRVGLISDTHGLLRPEISTVFSGVDLIIHAGDVGSQEVLDSLARMAPLRAVRGNNDVGEWSKALPGTALIEVDTCSLWLLHDLKDLAFDPKAAGLAAVIAGHSHRPKLEERNGVLFINPGSAGPRRFRLPISVGFLEICCGIPKATLHTLG